MDQSDLKTNVSEQGKAVSICDASAYTQVTGMTKQVLRCQKLTVARYIGKDRTVTNVIMFAFLFTRS